MEIDFEKAEARVTFSPDKILLDEAMEKLQKCGYKTGLKEPLVAVTRTKTLEVRAQISGTELAAGKSARLTVTVKALGKEDALVRKGDWSVRAELQAPDELVFPTEGEEKPKANADLTSNREGVDQDILTVDVLADAKASPGIKALKVTVMVNLKSSTQRDPENLEFAVPLLIAGGK